MRYYINAFKNYTKSYGRATRKDFWMFMLFHGIAIIILELIDNVIGWSPIILSDYYMLRCGYFTFIYTLISAVPSICLQVRRLHDIGKSGYWCLLGFVPALDLYLLCLNLEPSSPTTNKYGEPAIVIQENYAKRKKKMTLQKGIALKKGDCSQIEFCRKCGEKLIDRSNFCQKCGAEVAWIVDSGQKQYEKFSVCIFDVNSSTLRKEMRGIDVSLFPPAKFAFNDTYYAIEIIRDGKKVRTYYTKDAWDKQIEVSLQK